MKKKKEDSTQNQNYACLNPLCRKTFTNPIKVENLKSGTVYEPCPYCLMEITVEKPVLTPAEHEGENVTRFNLPWKKTYANTTLDI
ncbi:MAG: hypothetical protein QXX79_00585 [Candidatus Bathyarchaeia archaeon]